MSPNKREFELMTIDCLKVPCVVAIITVHTLGHYHVGQRVVIHHGKPVLRFNMAMFAHASKRLLGSAARSIKLYQEGDSDPVTISLLPDAIRWLRNHKCPGSHEPYTEFKRVADDTVGVQAPLSLHELRIGINEAFRYAEEKGLPGAVSGWNCLEIGSRHLRALLNQWNRPEPRNIREVLDCYDGSLQEAI